MKNLQEISISDIAGMRIGHAQDHDNATGCTVIIFDRPSPTGVDIRGGGPASRETPLLTPVAACEGLNAILLSGGSAYGLDAAGGVMKYLEERNVGFRVKDVIVPLVCTSCIYDLQLVTSKVRPDIQMAYEACLDSEHNRIDSGSIGAGTGATVGKLYGNEYMMKSGLGCYAVQIGELKVGAVVVVNALGDVYDIETGKELAGLLNKDKNGMLSTEESLYEQLALINTGVSNTTIGTVITNGSFDKTKMNKIAAMAQNGYSRSIRPVHTSADGDSIYASSVGDVKADTDVVGTIAAYVTGMAVKRAVTSVDSQYGLRCAKDFL